MRMGYAEWGLLVLLSVLWGGSFFFVAVALREFAPVTVVAWRVGLAALALWVFVAISGRPLPAARSAWIAFLGMGLLNNAIPFTLIAWGQQTISSGLASIFNATTPFFTVIVASIFLADERLTAKKLAGVGVGLCGVVFLVGPDALGGLSGDVLAQCAILAGACSYAFAGVFGRRFQRMGVDPVVTAAGQVSASTLILLPIALIMEGGAAFSLPSAPVALSIAGLALVSTACAYVIYFTLLSRAGATNLLLVTFLIPVTAVVLGAAVLGETIGGTQVAGMAVIAAGLALIDGRLLARNRKMATGPAVATAEPDGDRLRRTG